MRVRSGRPCIRHMEQRLRGGATNLEFGDCHDCRAMRSESEQIRCRFSVSGFRRGCRGFVGGLSVIIFPYFSRTMVEMATNSRPGDPPLLQQYRTPKLTFGYMLRLAAHSLAMPIPHGVAVGFGFGFGFRSAVPGAVPCCSKK